MQLYYFVLSTPSLATLMVAEATGIPYERILVDLRNGEQRLEEYLKINPMAKVPAMVDGELVLSESIAIQRYLARKTASSLYPIDIEQQARVDKWTELITHEIRTPVLDIEVYQWIARSTGGKENTGVVEVCQSRLDRALPVLNNHLADKEFLSGDDLTIADISLVSALDPVDAIGIDISIYPIVQAFLERGRNESWYQAVNTHFGAEFGL